LTSVNGLALVVCLSRPRRIAPRAWYNRAFAWPPGLQRRIGVKLKMAKNSLFAVLLRSPWWISFLVVLAFAAASFALLPAPYVVFGLMGALPFLVIGFIAMFRQLRAPSPAQVERTLQTAAALPVRDFATALEQAFRAQGYEVSPLTGQAADLRLIKGGRTSLVACKRWKAANHGAEPLRALDSYRQAQDASACVYVTLLELGDQTRRFAARHNVELLHGSALAQLLQGHLPR